jgi:hypothetical protein
MAPFGLIVKLFVRHYTRSALSGEDHTPTFIQQEWLAFWISLALLAVGAGSLSLVSTITIAALKGLRPEKKPGPEPPLAETA